MYRPNFCAECGVKIVRLHWHPWTSRAFCDACARGLRKERLRLPLISAALLLSLGVMTGTALRPAPPPLIIQRNSNSPLLKSGVSEAGTTGVQTQVIEEAVYICGARTKKGTPCSRRVHQPERCWQHKGMRAMLPAEKLKVK